MALEDNLKFLVNTLALNMFHSTTEVSGPANAELLGET
jgi:hypothetical protein